jgi:hypothetical protein
MHLVVDIQHFKTIEDLSRLIAGSRKLIMRAVGIPEKYDAIESVISQYDYLQLAKKEKWVVLRFLKIVTGYKKSQLHRLIDEALRGKLHHKSYVRSHAYMKYKLSDIRLLEHTDELHYRLSAPATHEIVRRQWEVFHEKVYEPISHISVSHISNLRDRDEYKASYLHHTQARQSSIGETIKPEPNGLPGYIRVDTVHQEAVYHINAVDEVTQWQVVVCVPHITEECLVNALSIIIDQFPFQIHNFHSDRGSEFINHVVAKLLQKLLIHQTKSRSRQCDDNALVECKNGAVIRKNLGFYHINPSLVKKHNIFFRSWFNPYLNNHRPCGFVTEVVTDHKGRERKIYGLYTTPYEKLKETIKEHKNKSILKPELSLELLDTIAYKYSDNDFAAQMRKRQYELFDISSFLKSD